MSGWTFLTDHAHVLVLLSHDPRLHVADLARQLEIPEDDVRGILSDLVKSGYLDERHGGDLTVRVVNRTLPLRHPVEAHHRVGHLLDAVQKPSELLNERLLH